MLGSRLEEISTEEQLRGCQATTTLITDESIQRQLLQFCKQLKGDCLATCRCKGDILVNSQDLGQLLGLISNKIMMTQKIFGACVSTFPIVWQLFGLIHKNLTQDKLS